MRGSKNLQSGWLPCAVVRKFVVSRGRGKGGQAEAVRQPIAEPVVFFCDEDIWKPHVGNVGRNKALGAMQLGDVLHGPGFHPLSLASQPTDYNDLLWLEGVEALGQQVGLAWHQRP